jgi:hypothetical protein
MRVREDLTDGVEAFIANVENPRGRVAAIRHVALNEGTEEGGCAFMHGAAP